MTDPDPPTPEERYDAAFIRIDDCVPSMSNKTFAYMAEVMSAFDALRDMIDSRDAETNRYLAVLTRHDNELTLLRARVRQMEGGGS